MHNHSTDLKAQPSNSVEISQTALESERYRIKKQQRINKARSRFKTARKWLLEDLAAHRADKYSNSNACGSGATRARAALPLAREERSSLDLINIHLPENEYSQVEGGGFPFKKPKNLFIPVDDYGTGRLTDLKGKKHYVAKVQPFKAGGAEIVFKQQDLEQQARISDSSTSRQLKAAARKQRTGYLSKSALNDSIDKGFDSLFNDSDFIADMESAGLELSPSRMETDSAQNSQISSIERSKRKVRHRIKSIGADRLLTLTAKESDPDKFMTVQDWAKKWEYFRKLCKQYGIDFEYVAVLETHKKGNYHLHAAINKKIRVDIARKLWHRVLGYRGAAKAGKNSPGNVDISYRQDMKKDRRLAGVAKYVSKYISKQIDSVEFNKKRYWSSKHSLPESVRIVLVSESPKSAVSELSARFGLDCGLVHDAVYIFASGDGAWLNLTDDMYLRAEIGGEGLALREGFSDFFSNTEVSQ